MTIHPRTGQSASWARMMASLYQALKSVARGVRALSSAILQFQIEDFRLRLA